MNKDRRNRLIEVADSLEDAIIEINDIRDEEQEAYDNLPESLQSSSKGEIMQDYIDGMDNLISSIEEVQGEIRSLAEG